MDREIMIKKMKDIRPIKEKELEENVIDVGDMTFANLRDSIIGLGTILDEDFEMQSYVVSVPAGIANKNNAIVAVQLEKGRLSLLAYAKE